MMRLVASILWVCWFLFIGLSAFTVVLLLGQIPRGGSGVAVAKISIVSQNLLTWIIGTAVLAILQCLANNTTSRN